MAGLGWGLGIQADEEVLHNVGIMQEKSGDAK